MILQPPRADGVAELLLGPRWADLGQMASRSSASDLGGPAAGQLSQTRGYAVSRLSRDRRLPDGLFPTNLTLELRVTHFQRCPASRTMAELATADRTRRTRKA